jgi:hypothetical protein
MSGAEFALSPALTPSAKKPFAAQTPPSIGKIENINGPLVELG